MRAKIILGTSGTIDLFEDIPVSLNYAIADIRKPDTRQGAYSKTISIPGSKSNDKLFAHIFEIDIDCRFNANIRTPCTISIDEIEQISGFLRLMKIKKLDDNKIEYECSVIGSVSNIFTTWGDAELTALNMSAYNHTYNKTAQKASWTAPIGTGYVYPMIDYGFTNSLTYDVTNFYPAIYVKTYVDKMFEYGGAVYQSNFFNSNTFKRLIIPLSSNLLKLTDAQITPRLFEANLSSSGTINMGALSGVGTTYNVPIDTDVSDPSNQYNTSTYRFVSSYSGSFNFSTAVSYQLNSAHAFAPIGWLLLIKYSGGSFTTLGSVNLNAFGGIDTTLRTATLNANDILIAPGDEVFVQMQVFTTGTGTPNINIGTATFQNSVNNIGIFDGDTVDMSSATPQKIKMKEFFMSLVKMFNLYIEVDKDVSNKYYIEPRNDFYALGETVDWTEKWDISQSLDIEPMGELDARKYLFTYSPDKDYYNELYTKSWNEVYGQQQIDVNNEFIQGTKENKVIFSPTPLVNNGASDRTIPAIFSTDSAGNIVPKQSNIRILYYGGEKATAFPWTYTGAISGTSTETTYPYAGHLDSVTAPTIDLSFGVPKEIYYDTTVYTNGNLYNTYHKQFIEEITDKDSKIITGWFYLTPLDILTLDFRNEFVVDTHFLRLNKIMDYNPIKQGLTKCEFIKIKNANSFTVQEKEIVGGNNGSFDDGSATPVPTSTGKVKMFQSTGVSTNNYVASSAENTLVTGDRNSVGEGAKHVIISNSSGCTVMGGLTGVSLFNCSGVTVTDNDSYYVNNVRIRGGYSDGSFAPKTYNTTNVTSSSATNAQFYRVGDRVTVSGIVTFTATLPSVSTVLGIDIPIASDFIALEQCSGIAFSGSIAGMGSAIVASIANNRANLLFISSDVASNSWTYHYTYTVR